MVTRQSELQRVLSQIAGELEDPLWVALVDEDGFIVGCVPPNPPIDGERISAMAAAVVGLAERVMQEIDGGVTHYVSVVGSARQHLILVLNEDRFLSIGLSPEVPARSTFGALRRWVPEIFSVLQKRFASG